MDEPIDLEQNIIDAVNEKVAQIEASVTERAHQKVAKALDAADEVARLAMFGHAPSCMGHGTAGEADDFYDPDCNLCRALDALKTRRAKLQ